MSVTRVRRNAHAAMLHSTWNDPARRHGGSYYKISTSTRGKIKVVDRKTYKPTPGEKATIIYADTEASGRLLRAAAANAAAQRAGREDE